MATTYTTHLGIKKIGSGLEAGTWGTSTNQNFDRIEAALTRSVEIDLLAMPTGSTNATSDGTTEAQWVLVDAADSGDSEESGSEGRAFNVSVIGAMAATGDLNIRTDSAGVYADRTYVITNNLSNSHDLIVYGDAANALTIPNGASAFVSISSVTDGLIVKGANNLLLNPIINDIVMPGTTSSITMKGTGSLNVKAGSATAFVINDEVNDLVKIDATVGTEVITLDAASGTTVDVSGAGSDQPFELIVHPTHATAFTVTDGTVDALGVDHAANEVIIGETGESKDLRIWGDIIVSDIGTTYFTFKDEEATALVFREGTTAYMVFDSTGGAETVDVTKKMTMPDLLMTGADAYVNFGSTEGSGGAGIRLNSGTLELSNADSETWGEPYHSGVADGLGVYIKTGQLSVADNATSTEAHGFSAIPKILIGSLVCTSTDIGWTAGDEIPISQGGQRSHEEENNITIYADTTNVGVRVGSSGFSLTNFSDGSTDNADPTKWKCVIRAWK
jgi:hypothetical protein